MPLFHKVKDLRRSNATFLSPKEKCTAVALLLPCFFVMLLSVMSWSILADSITTNRSLSWVIGGLAISMLFIGLTIGYYMRLLDERRLAHNNALRQAAIHHRMEELIPVQETLCGTFTD